MRRLVVSKDFQKQIDGLSETEREKIQKTLKVLLASVKQGAMPKGLGFKKLDRDKYEIRVDIKTRIVLKVDEDAFILLLAGSHDQIKKHLKNL